jgi:hypothetical protein
LKNNLVHQHSGFRGYPAWLELFELHRVAAVIYRSFKASQPDMESIDLHRRAAVV